ncbi:MAG: hypothetical protein JW864_03220 [Spirochaetes bacterium]|nr:hypothetical protein [Spirochaetota bacterium]
MIIALKTCYNTSLGMGHIQRMCSLAWYLNANKKLKAYIVSDDVPDTFPDELKPYLKNTIDFSPEIIIRDMRDSETDEIIQLKKTGKIVCIDDNGPGAEKADYIIDILPNLKPHEKSLKFNSYIYGFNFLKSLENLKKRIINKNIDFSVYPGNSAEEEYIDFLISILPEKSNFAMLCGKKSYLRTNEKKIPMSNSYADVLLSSKILVSHFGITLYEGLISGCGLITINPSDYHSDLTDLIKNKFNLINLGESGKLNSNDAEQAAEKMLKNAEFDNKVNPAEVHQKVLNGLEEFYNLILNI